MPGMVPRRDMVQGLMGVCAAMALSACISEPILTIPAAGDDASAGDDIGGADVGADGNETPDSAEVVDAPASTCPVTEGQRGWVALTPMSQGGRFGHGGAVVGNSLWAVGGIDRELNRLNTAISLDVDECVWRNQPSLPVAVNRPNVAAINGDLYVLGFLGARDAADGRSWVLRGGEFEWDELARMPEGRERGAAAVAVVDGEIVVAGGFRDGAAVAQADVYSPSLDSWRSIADMPDAQDRAVAAVVGGRMIVAAGRRGELTRLVPEPAIWNPQSASWSVGAAIPTPRAGAAAAAIGDEVFVAGGEGNPQSDEEVFNTFEAYNAATNTWRSVGGMPNPRHGASAGVVDGVFYIVGGAIRSGDASDLNRVNAWVP